ncbi:putative metal-dependent hydrolase [Caulobacter ginsengisoli]|uniref:Metal-dependent hydrolase n=1 Tax=Caulobacter ginsengisoli TaxID=400775 RepID=A0ABU0IS29_9CAUL|nr:metal-dependent hydrolase [Caulobacter ginsengisoli]MDQ0464817.1 putative metal-dependent hydrolase [Caulobacter ginsengisoli]
MIDASRTPADLTIQPRNYRFQSEQAEGRWWLNGDPLATAWHNALSGTFPEGEKLFIEAVARFKDRVGEPLRGQIAAFVRQEAAHTREHLAFNQALARRYNMSGIEIRTLNRVAFARTRPHLGQLAATAALEHFTAILAHDALTHPEDFDGAPEALVKLWRWHAVEEIEHKAVAFDVLAAVMADLPPVRRWMMRSISMALITLAFGHSMIVNTADLLRQDGIEPRSMRGAAWRYFVFGKPGVLRRILPHYLAWYRPGFHPWQKDDRALLAGIEDSLVPAAAV